MVIMATPVYNHQLSKPIYRRYKTPTIDTAFVCNISLLTLSKSEFAIQS